MTSSRILYTKPSITSLEISYATDAASNGWGPRCYDYIHRFEADFARHLDIGHAIATSSCTGAMHMGLAALGIGPGDEVILADTNWVATVAPIVHLGATPIFVDVLEDSWCIDPVAVRRAITSQTKAIVATHTYGNLCDLDALLTTAKEHNIVLIEDAAEAIGSIYRGRRAGSIGHFGVFSFHGTKTLTTGEGGMFVTADAELFERVSTLSNHGRRRGQTRQFWPDEIGFKYKMSNLQAAIGVAQLERVETLVARKREIYSSYLNRLRTLEGITMNPDTPSMVNGCWMPTVVFEEYLGIQRERLIERFTAAQIDARVFFWPLSSLPMFTPQPENLHSYSIPNRAINLPSYHDLSADELDRVCVVIEDIYKETRTT